MRKYEGYESFVLKTLRLRRKKEREPFIVNDISTVKLLPVTYMLLFYVLEVGSR